MFDNQDQLQRSAMLALSFNVSTDELSGLNEEFQAMDLDGNGTIDLEEFVTAFSGKGSSKDELESAFKAIDQVFARTLNEIGHAGVLPLLWRISIV